jgi:hypothetical protein
MERNNKNITATIDLLIAKKFANITFSKFVVAADFMNIENLQKHHICFLVQTNK